MGIICKTVFSIDTGKKFVTFHEIGSVKSNDRYEYRTDTLLMVCGYFEKREKIRTAMEFRDHALAVHKRVSEYEKMEEFDRPILTKGLVLSFLGQVIDQCEEHPKASVEIRF